MRNKFIGAFSVDRDKEKLNSCWEENKNFLSKTSFLKLFYEGNNISFNTVDNIIVLFYGEIKEYLSVIPKGINETTIESIVWLYRKFGDGFAKYIDGHFTIVLYDRLTKKFIAIQDKYTCYEKLFWIKKNGIFYFSNSIIELAYSSNISKTNISKTALYQFLKYSYTIPPKTIFKNIYQMTIGEMIVINSKSLHKLKYDGWAFSDNRIKDKNEAIDLYKKILTRCIYNQYSANSPSVFLLSGGFDSSLNIALGSQKISEPLISVGIGADDKFNTDAPYARMVAKLFNTKHHEYYFDGSEINDLPQIVYNMEVPYFEPGLLLTHSALKEASKYSNFAIGGEAADQIFGCCGPSAFQRYTNQKKIGILFETIYNLTKKLCRNNFLDRYYLAHKIEGRLISKFNVNNWCGVYGFRDCDIKEMLRKNFHFEEKYDESKVPYENLTQLYDYCCIKPNIEYAFYGILACYNPLSELNNITCYSPYLDREIIEFILSLDQNLRAPMSCSKDLSFNSKYLQKELAKTIFPPQIIDRPKQGGAISPGIHFINDSFLSRIKTKLLNSEIIKHYFKTNIINNLFIQPNQNATRIFLLLNLDLWHNLFISNSTQQMPSYTLLDYIE